MWPEPERRRSTALVAVARQNRRPITAGRTAYHVAVAAITVAAVATALSWTVVEDVSAIVAFGALLTGSVAGIRARHRRARLARRRWA
ncbi:MAG: hypothetical protein S0880_14960 [Actinomycetota bacterium]|nr:hypothetical protein [Actinomycetota bacterium]